MPELRSRARRNRAPNNPDPNPITQPQPAAAAVDDDDDENKLSLRTLRRRRGTGQNRRGNSVYNRNNSNNKKKNDAIGGVDDRKNVRAKRSPKVIIETRSFKSEEEEEETRVLRQEVEERAMDEYDSGGRSGDKGLAAEDEGSTAPIPEKVFLSFQILFFFWNNFLEFCLVSVWMMRNQRKNGGAENLFVVLCFPVVL